MGHPVRHTDENFKTLCNEYPFLFPPFAGILRDAKCHRELRLSSLDRYHTRVSSTRHIWLNVHIAGDLGYYSWRGRFSNYITWPASWFLE